MSDHTILNNNNQVFQSIHMAERQPSTNTTSNNLSINKNTQFTVNNTLTPQHQQFSNISIFQQPLPLSLPIPPPPPPAAFQMQPTIQKLNPTAPTFTPNHFLNIPFNNNTTQSVQGYNNNNNAFIALSNQIQILQKNVQESLDKLQILSIQLNTLQLINQRNATIESLNQYQNIYQQYNILFTNTLAINQYLNNLNNIKASTLTTASVTPVKATDNNNNKKSGFAQLETIEEGEDEEEEDDIAPIAGIADNTADTAVKQNDNEGTNIAGEQLSETKLVKNLWKFPSDVSNYALSTNDTNYTTNTTVFGEQHVHDVQGSELERIKTQICVILNKITAENFDKLSQEIASILRVSDIALTELNKNKMLSAKELYKLQKTQFKDLIKLILSCILEKAINETLFSNEYARLCYSLYIYMEDNKLQKKLFRQQLLSICHSIFAKAKKDNENDRFIGIVILLGELFHFGLVSWNVIWSGIFDKLLPPQSAIDIEAICKLLKTTGYDFDRHHHQDINLVINNLSKHAQKFDFQTKCLVREIYEMRGNDWKQYNTHKKQQLQPKTQLKTFYNENNNKNTKKYYNTQRNNNNNNRGWRNNNRYGSYNNSYNRRKQKNFRPSVEFVKDVTLQDRSHYAPNKILTKTWAMRNSGEIEWGDNVELVYFKGDKRLSLEDRYPVMNAQSGEKVEISATIKTPNQPGRYCTYFRLQKNGKFFGPRVWVDIIVNNIQQEISIDGRQNCATNYEANNTKILSCQ